MARVVMAEQLARDVFTSLQAVSCPLVEELKLQDCDSILQLLCAPSQHRTDIFSWICCRIEPNFCSSITKSTLRSKDQEGLWKEVAVLGQELMLCRAADQDLIKEGRASVQQQLHFLQQLLTLVPGSKLLSGSRMDTELLLNELYASENVSQLSHMLTPTFDPWPSHIKTLQTANRASCKDSREEAADVSGLLQLTSSALEKLQSECDFLKDNMDHSQGVFSPSFLQVATGDLWQLLVTFSRVYEADLRAYCSRDPPRFSADADVFQRTQQLLKTFVMELEVLKELPEAFLTINGEVSLLQTQPCYQSGGQKLTFYERLEELVRRVRDFSSLLHSRMPSATSGIRTE